MILRTAPSRAATCLLCQWRSFSVSYRRPANKTPKPPPAAAPVAAPPNTTSSPAATPAAKAASPAAEDAPKDTGPLAFAPRAYGPSVKEFTPTALTRPIGMHSPPSAGENTGIDPRSLKQRRDDFVDYKKHLAKREQLKSKLARPYFRDWSNMQFHKGKTFLAPPRPFKADLSLYFPNLHGRTLSKAPGADAADTTPVLEGRASVVTVFSSLWAENQARTFTLPEANPALHAALASAGGRAQLVRVNVEEDVFKAWLVRLFMGSLRRKTAPEDWGRYFLVSRGISNEIRESIGVLNSKVGYTYLVDHECRIRWAGSGNAEPGEREGLVKSLYRLLDEMAREGVGANYVRKPVIAAAAAAVAAKRGVAGAA
ncbi:ATP10 protein-domain-containing protein [Lasiosphaeria ovina]|uniref:ATP10 protein-domain-containing protein n=1 Tax=Lasiosphaeria ovina TaxID=92902 RepID=A0AAE0NL09_9PEZI|nr:ATP10 protein-domain-containing protein [Lasiosphaeria ovina]